MGVFKIESPSLKVIEPSKTIFPFDFPTTGLMKTSPAGIFPPVPGFEKSPSSNINFLFSTEIVISVPPGAFTTTFTAPENFSSRTLQRF